MGTCDYAWVKPEACERLTLMPICTHSCRLTYSLYNVHIILFKIRTCHFIQTNMITLSVSVVKCLWKRCLLYLHTTYFRTKNLFTFTFLMKTPSVRIIAETHSLCIPETCTKRQTTQHGRLLRLLGDGDKGIKIVYGGEEKNILYWPTIEQPRQKNKIYCTGTTSPTNQPRKDPFHLSSCSPLSFNSQQ